ncbi:hypothetical protein OH76DRAFT_1359590 [Lentinus brumalis]|uniref:Uncharacterized protein n=1 Tax=Lentinus brumalis TaxID=2498619 RepID=A0A371CW24_9APHY|nr:hypothetical protein OH76DRAFT_1359590 [Polyporus brumalis]
MAVQRPQAPQLTDDAILIVFVHYAAPPAVQQHPVFGDCHRLAVLGRPMLEAAYRDAMRRRFPNLHGNTGQQHVDATFPNFVARWVGEYGWRRWMRGVPPNVNLNDQQEMLRVFETYAGAVVVQQSDGQAVLFSWIWELVNTP